jgi:hypothetical protein
MAQRSRLIFQHFSAGSFHRWTGTTRQLSRTAPARSDTRESSALTGKLDEIYRRDQPPVHEIRSSL